MVRRYVLQKMRGNSGETPCVITVNKLKALISRPSATLTCELEAGEIYRGHLTNCEDCVDAMLEGVTVTARELKVTNLDHVHVRGSLIRYFILSDMMRHAPSFKKKVRRAGRVQVGWLEEGRPRHAGQAAQRQVVRSSRNYYIASCLVCSEGDSLRDRSEGVN